MKPNYTENARAYLERMNAGAQPPLNPTDPELVERFANFAFDETINDPAAKLDDRPRLLSLLAVLLGCQGLDEVRVMLPAALRLGLDPVAAREVVYQAVDYLGMGRVFPFIGAMNEAFRAAGLELPLPDQATTTRETRLEKGAVAQTAIFGERMVGFSESGPEESRHINRWLVDNCFGDYYTRTGLTLAERELVTFCYLYAQGGCEPQLKAHIGGNLNLGNDKEFLIRVISCNVPFIGYPRTLNALACIREVCG